MSCTPTPTSTQYETITTFTPSTSYSQSGPTEPQANTAVQSCVASGTISGKAECISSTPVTQANTVGGGQAAQVPIVVTVPVTETRPTQTLYAPCSGGSSSAAPTSTPSSTNAPLTTSVLVQSTPPPSTVVEASSTTLADGSVVQTIVTIISTLPATAVYEPSTIPNPSLQSDVSQGSGTNIAPILGGVFGGFVGLIAIVGSLWWLCRRRRTWDDIFEKEDFQGDDRWAPAIPVRRERDRHRLDLSAEPKPYEYGLVGHVVPPTGSGSPRVGSVTEMSDIHSRHTSFSATPLLQPHHTGSSRPSTSGSVLTVQTHPAQQRVMSPVGSTETGPRSLSMVSHSTSSTAPLLDARMTPAVLGAWTPNTDEFAVLEPLNCAGGPVSPSERRILQIVNDGPPSPTETVVASPRLNSSRVKVHTDGGRVPESFQAGVPSTEPPAYS